MSRLKLFNLFAAVAFVLVACAQPTATPAANNTAAPADTAMPAGTEEPTAVPTADLSKLPVVPAQPNGQPGLEHLVADRRDQPVGVPGYTHQEGNAVHVGAAVRTTASSPAKKSPGWLTAWNTMPTSPS